MCNLDIIDVFAVYGDYGNVGSGSLIGVFEDEGDACEAAKGRGSLDCGGDGSVHKRKGVRSGEEVYLLETDSPVGLNAVARPDPRQRCSFGIVVTSVSDLVKFIQIVRRRTGMSLQEAKRLYDAVARSGRAVVEPFSGGRSPEVTLVGFMEWKTELKGIATVEAI